MTDRTRHQPTPCLYAGLMLGAGVMALTAAWSIAQALSGDSQVTTLSMLCIAAGALGALAPALFGPRAEAGNWGLAVVGTSITRTILMLVLGLVLAPKAGPETRPFWLSLSAGAGVLLIAEAWVSISILTRLEALKAARHAAPPSPSPEHA